VLHLHACIRSRLWKQSTEKVLGEGHCFLSFS
jgi:hypothetical protein